MSELKPCPFCGSVAIPTSYPDRGDAFIYRVECSHNCAAGDCSASTNMMATQEAAAEAWNTRPPCAACAASGDGEVLAVVDVDAHPDALFPPWGEVTVAMMEARVSFSVPATLESMPVTVIVKSRKEGE